ncbi:molybdopterin converting factor subunit 1 [Moraxellaceae bacterium AER2_44_116]|nr:molybdopterin converting factor subunit 1 [Moraxellaceae bacterium]TQC99890.1 molybdopterin converting factor subunit 1 [Moraxellaceae bacterium AER2_44_116]
MTIKLCFFARFREKLAINEESYTLESTTCTVEQLLMQLAARGEVWSSLFDGSQNVLVAINQNMATLTSSVSDGDEVAFFPPVTGG